MSRTSTRFLIATFFVVLLASATHARKVGAARFTARAFSIEGQAADGSRTRMGTVAADPRILPFGTRIRVSEAGIYSGDYTVVDSGSKVKGHVIDIYMSSVREALEFGKRTVRVEILEKSR